MTNDERRIVYQKWLSLTQEIKRLNAEKESAYARGDKVFHELKSTNNVEIAYEKADEAGWLLYDELSISADSAKLEVEGLFKTLQENQFELSEFQSCCAYGISDKKPVKVILLDGRELIGVVYPLVYDNPQEMLLVADDGSEYFLDEGWEVYDVLFL